MDAVFDAAVPLSAPADLRLAPVAFDHKQISALKSEAAKLVLGHLESFHAGEVEASALNVLDAKVRVVMVLWRAGRCLLKPSDHIEGVADQSPLPAQRKLERALHLGVIPHLWFAD